MSPHGRDGGQQGGPLRGDQGIWDQRQHREGSSDRNDMYGGPQGASPQQGPHGPNESTK